MHSGRSFDEEARKALITLGRLVEQGKATSSSRGQPVVVDLHQPLLGENDILVVVMGPRGALVTRSQSRGREVDLNQLRLRLLGAEVAVDAIMAAGASPKPPPLSRTEEALLDQAGLTEPREPTPGALEKSRIEYELLLRNSYTLQAAAKVLSVNPSRLRQRLSPQTRTLFGVKDGRAWRLPRFQFDKGRPIRGIEKVIPRIRLDAHPLAVQSWFLSPHQDLVYGPNEEPVSPRDWLQAGNAPEVVAELAAEI